MTLIISPRSQDIGFPVKRLLPSRFKQRVGPFIFLDHMGPAIFPADTTLGDVRPHPHIGLATVTYMLEGAMIHRDSLGNVQRIEPGDINVMTAGKGIVHSERVPDDIRKSATALRGLQMWIALPTEFEGIDPDFQHYPANQIPQYDSEKITACVLIGSAFGLTSPVKTLSETTYLYMNLRAQATYSHMSESQELAIYTISGHVTINGQLLEENHLLVLEKGEGFTVNVDNSSCQLLILGGSPLMDERFILWNFVASSKEQLQQASERWELQQFGYVPGESEWIPLPKNKI